MTGTKAFRVDDDTDTGSLSAMVEDTVRRILSKHWTGGFNAGDVKAVFAAFKEAGFNSLGRTGGKGDVPLCVSVCRELGRVSCNAPFPAMVLENIVFAKSPRKISGEIAVFAAADEGIEVGAERASGIVRFIEHAALAQTLTVLVPGYGVLRVDLINPGVEITRETILGGYDVDAIRLSDVPIECVPLDQHEVDDLSLISRLLSCATALGAAERGFEMVLEYARERKQFGRPIGSFQAVQHKLANSRMILDASRMLVDRAASSCRPGGSQWLDNANGAILFCQVHLRKIALETHHCFGAIGFAEEHDAPTQFRVIHAEMARSGGLKKTSREYAEFLLNPVRADKVAEIDEDDTTAALRAKVRNWLDEAWSEADRQENAALPFSNRHWNLDFARKMGCAGWTTINWPSDEGGLDLSPVEQLAFSEEFIRQGAPDGSTIAGSRLLATEIIAHGSPRLKSEMMPLLRSGEASICLGYSEPGAGSDLASLQTKAAGISGGYVVNGQKIWTSDGHRASHMILAARTNPDPDVKHGAITLFVVPMNTPGITVRPMPALHGHIFCNVFLDDVRIPEWTRLGKEGEGWSILNNALASERVVMGAFASQLDDLLNRMIAEVRGGRLKDAADIRTGIALLAADVRAARLLSLRSIELSGGDHTPLVESAMAKIFASELSQRLTETAIDIFGPAAMLDSPSDGAVADGLIGQLLRRSIMMVVGGGSNEIQRNVIALRGLHLPSK
ncbi:acyl-CoA dehydrogenase family protein [Croceicoccus sediminis]|uniref:acyl-CoA dehydrogenase family protein n=1 Tax=Croceicoccus sediminis TaxID=2571150 RepID=UPI00147815BA|nr:acyl-CoA dehydrogenase family protein [Croceicoccus sediminis]